MQLELNRDPSRLLRLADVDDAAVPAALTTERSVAHARIRGARQDRGDQSRQTDQLERMHHPTRRSRATRHLGFDPCSAGSAVQDAGRFQLTNAVRRKTKQLPENLLVVLTEKRRLKF
jgi:hypothetical protein